MRPSNNTFITLLAHGFQPFDRTAYKFGYKTISYIFQILNKVGSVILSYLIHNKRGGALVTPAMADSQCCPKLLFSLSIGNQRTLIQSYLHSL
jgi:hypothetical protein